MSETTPAEPIVLTPEEQWVVNSVRPLETTWNGRCLTCRFWEPLTRRTHGRCQQVVSDSTNDEITLWGTSDAGAETSSSFGCTLWGECDQDKKILRAALGIELEMLSAMPKDGE